MKESHLLNTSSLLDDILKVYTISLTVFFSIGPFYTWFEFFRKFFACTRFSITLYMKWDTKMKEDGGSMDDGVDRDGVGVNWVYSRKYFNETASKLQGLKIGKNKLT